MPWASFWCAQVVSMFVSRCQIFSMRTKIHTRSCYPTYFISAHIEASNFWILSVRYKRPVIDWLLLWDVIQASKHVKTNFTVSQKFYRYQLWETGRSFGTVGINLKKIVRFSICKIFGVSQNLLRIRMGRKENVRFCIWIIDPFTFFLEFA